jgi:hypothetical protein
MAVINKGIESESVSQDGNGIFSATITWKLVATANETSYLVGSDSTLPAIGRLHPAIPDCWCTNLTCTMTEPKTGFTAVASYSSKKEITEDPLAEPPEVNWDTEQFQEPVVIDEDGEAVLNSAGDPYDPPVMKDDSRWYCEVTANVESVPAWVLTYRDSVNEEAFVIDGIPVEIGQAKIQKLKISTRKVRNGTGYRVVLYHLHFKEDGWHAKPLDAGFRRKYNATDRELITMTNDAGEQEYPVAPVPLDGSGVELLDPTPATAVYGDHTIYKVKPFSVLPGVQV